MLFPGKNNFIFLIFNSSFVRFMNVPHGVLEPMWSLVNGDQWAHTQANKTKLSITSSRDRR